MITPHIHDGTLRILVKPHAPADAILGYDAGRKAVRVAVRAKAKENQANIAVIRLFKRMGYTVRILRGLTSREKVVQIL
ncbi:MAG TPA: DUF167 domain-containing protein [Candidatus Nanoarchaeia archaeon]|nr:DUF167 domain-containing protein [Candidatus Nanoarchaeia archaeon]